MATQFIKTGEIARQDAGAAGALAEVLGEKICGAKNVVGNLRWLEGDHQLGAQAPANTHRLIYVMDGDAVISLEQKDYEVGKGAGVYLGPEESASIRPAQGGSVKLFELIVPEVQD